MLYEHSVRARYVCTYARMCVRSNMHMYVLPLGFSVPSCPRLVAVSPMVALQEQHHHLDVPRLPM
jgi:hypothetical protein